MTMWQRLRALTPFDRRLLLEAGTLMCALQVCLRLLPFTSVRRGLDAIASWRVQPESGMASAARIVWAVQAAGARLPATTCLVEALAADTLLRRHGAASTLRIGVRRGSPLSLDAHAWVECDGTPIIGTSSTDYAPLT
jgi:hypothetical protein